MKKIAISFVLFIVAVSVFSIDREFIGVWINSEYETSGYVITFTNDKIILNPLVAHSMDDFIEYGTPMEFNLEKDQVSARWADSLGNSWWRRSATISFYLLSDTKLLLILYIETYSDGEINRNERTFILTKK